MAPDRVAPPRLVDGAVVEVAAVGAPGATAQHAFDAVGQQLAAREVLDLEHVALVPDRVGGVGEQQGRRGSPRRRRPSRTRARAPARRGRAAPARRAALARRGSASSAGAAASSRSGSCTATRHGRAVLTALEGAAVVPPAAVADRDGQVGLLGAGLDLVVHAARGGRRGGSVRAAVQAFSASRYAVTSGSSWRGASRSRRSASGRGARWSRAAVRRRAVGRRRDVTLGGRHVRTVAVVASNCVAVCSNSVRCPPISCPTGVRPSGRGRPPCASSSSTIDPTVAREQVEPIVTGHSPGRPALRRRRRRPGRRHPVVGSARERSSRSYDAQLDDPGRVAELLRPTCSTVARGDGAPEVGSVAVPPKRRRGASSRCPARPRGPPTCVLDLDPPIADPGAVELRDMSREEFDAFFARVVDDYAADAGPRPGSRPRGPPNVRRADQTAQLIPSGIDSPGEEFFHGWVGDERGRPAVARRRASRWRSSTTSRCVEAQRRKGYGAAIMNAAALWSRAHGHPVLGLNVFAHNPGAKALYDRLGYRGDGRLPHLRRPGCLIPGAPST